MGQTKGNGPNMWRYWYPDQGETQGDARMWSSPCRATEDDARWVASEIVSAQWSNNDNPSETEIVVTSDFCPPKLFVVEARPSIEFYAREVPNG